jgi:hypothetical protein
MASKWPRAPARDYSQCVRDLPQPPGDPDHRSADRYLLWMARREWRPLLWAGALCSGFTATTVLLSAAIGGALDSALDTRSVLAWAGVLTAIITVSVVFIPLAHRAECFNWYASSYRTVQVICSRSADLGPTLTRRLPSGEVIAVGSVSLLVLVTATATAVVLPETHGRGQTPPGA